MTLSALLRVAAPRLPTIMCGVAFLGVATLAELRLPAVGGDLLDVYSKSHHTSASDEPPNIESDLVHIVTLVIAMAVAKHVGEYLLRLAGERTVMQVRTELFEKLLTSDIGFFDERPPAVLVSMLVSDVQACHNSLTWHLPLFAKNLIVCIVSGAHMAALSPRLTALGVSAAPIIGIQASLIGRVVTRLARRQQEQLGTASSLATESLASVRCIQAFGQEALVSARFKAEVAECERLALREMLVHKLWNTLNFLLAGLTTLFLLREAGRDILAGALTSGSAISFAVYGNALGHAADAAANELQKASASAARAGAALQMLEERGRAHASAMASAGLAAPPTGEAAARVLVRDVRFAYPSSAVGEAGRRWALDCLSFEMTTGRVSALVGPSGSGKSTALNLLLRFYTPDDGTITIGGVALGALPTAWLREHVGIVSQEPTLFLASIYDNIAFGRRLEAASGAAEVAAEGTADGHVAQAERLERMVRHAAHLAGAHDFILEAGGYGAAVGDRGLKLSGGQRQRIAIARVLLRDPSVLLLDEATASLDAKSEQHIQSSLAALTRGRSTLVVAHRLATVRSADEIIVLDQGAVVERGTHGNLAAAGGLYARLVALQHLQGSVQGGS